MGLITRKLSFEDDKYFCDDKYTCCFLISNQVAKGLTLKVV